MLRLALSSVPTFGQRVAWVLLGLLAAFGIFYITVGAAQRDRFGCWYYGGDFIAFYSSARLILAGEGASVYDIDVQRGLQQSLLTEGGSACAHGTMPVEYFAAALLPFVPLGLLPPHTAFDAWALVSLAASAFAVWRLATAAHVKVWPLWLWIIGSPYVYIGVLIGQVHAVLLIAVTEFVIAFRQDRERLAGFWLSFVLIKPQFLPLLGLLLLWKRRWRALAATAVAGVVFFAISTLLVGFDGLLAQSRLLLLLKGAPMMSDQGAVGMTNWRAIAVDASRFFGWDASAYITIALTAATLLAVFLGWRHRPWHSLTPIERDELVLVVTVASLLVGFDTHVHSDVLMIAPALLLVGASLQRELPTMQHIKVRLLEGLLLAPGVCLPILLVTSVSLGRSIQLTGYLILLLMGLIVMVFSGFRIAASRQSLPGLVFQDKAQSRPA